MIFINIISSFPATIYKLAGLQRVHYAGKTAGGKIYKVQSTHIPINVNASAIIGIIFAISVMQYPVTIKPNEMADNMHKSSGFTPGIRLGETTARYIENVLTKVAVLGYKMF